MAEIPELPEKYQSIVNKIREVFFSTIVQKHQATLKRETQGGLITISNDDDDEFIAFGDNNKLIDGEYDNLDNFLRSVTSISVSFAYQFGEGHIKQKKGSPKHVPEWWSPFRISHADSDQKGLSLWDEYIEKSLTNFSVEFPYVSTDSDSDFGYQDFSIRLSKNKSTLYECSDESEE